MLQVATQSRIYLAVEPVDFRRGIDGLARACRELFDESPMAGSLFLFCNKRRTSFRILAHDGQGYWLCTKRLSQGKLQFWPRANKLGAEQMRLTVSELQILLWNGDPTQAGAMWKRIDTDVAKAT